MSKQSISLSQELWLLVRAVQGVRQLSEFASQSPGQGVDRNITVSAVSALLALVEGRLVTLDRTITDTVDPVLLWSQSNAAKPEDDTPDIRLVEWTAKHSLKKAKEELRRAKLRRASEERGKGGGL